jgi:biotin synthase-like enzyme
MKTKEEISELAKGNDRRGYERNCFIDGYTQCQQDMADKKLDIDDINEMALDYIINTGGLPKTIEEWQNALWKFYQSLNKQD